MSKDPVVLDELYFDRLQEAQEVLLEQGREFAQSEYENGDLDDWLQDDCDPVDTFRIALATLQWLDIFLAGNYEDFEAALTGLNESLGGVAINVRDFRATIEHVIEDRAKLIAEDM